MSGYKHILTAEAMMKFPYSISDFYDIITEKYFYIDRTDRIPLIEKAGKHLLFLRPRRFGKSLLLSMLKNYYDIAKADEFELLFGKLAIGSNPTKRHNQYFVLEWDFSMVEPSGDAHAIRSALHRYVNATIKRFATYLASLLYFFGILTFGGVTVIGTHILQVPNLAVRGLFLERLRKMLLPNTERNDMVQVAETFYNTGALKPVCDFIEQNCFKAFDNRDYRWANELTVKTAFLSLLFNDTLYITDSETALERGYADMTMIVRPDKRQFQLLDFLFEFKYVGLKDNNLSGAKVKAMTDAELKTLAPVKLKLAESAAKLKGYRQTLESAYDDKLRLRCYSVVAVGFDRLVQAEI